MLEFNLWKDSDKGAAETMKKPGGKTYLVNKKVCPTAETQVVRKRIIPGAVDCDKNDM